MNINNRRYIGNKAKLLNWIFSTLKENTQGNSFLDLFAGTGSVANKAIDLYETVNINDFLSSN